MPDQFGNITPAEALQALANRAEAMRRSAQTPQARREANLYNLGQALSRGANPTVVKAREIEAALRTGTQLTRNPNETAIDFQIRQARQMFDDVKNVDPTTAAQLSEQLTQLETERAEQARIQESHELDVEASELAISAARRENMFDGIQYGYDPQTGKVSNMIVDFNDPDHLDQLRAMQEANLVPIPASDVVGLLDTSAADMTLWNNSGYEARLETLSTQVQNVQVANQLATVLEGAMDEGINPATYFGRVEAGLLGALNTFDEAKGLVGDEAAPPIGSEEWNEDVSRMRRHMQTRTIPEGVTAELLTALAYSTARTYDNRVTDQDFDKAYRMLGGATGSPANIMANVRQIVFGQQQTALDTVGLQTQKTLEHAPEGSKGYIQAQIIQAQMDVLNQNISKFDAASSRILEAFGVSDIFTEPAPSAGAINIPGRGRMQISVGQ